MYTFLIRLTTLPEANVFMFAFLLNYPWEFLQVPLFQNLMAAPHWEAVKLCTRAAVGDAAITLIAFWAVAARAHTRSWMLRPTRSQLLGFVGVGLGITVVIERLATGPLGLWTDRKSVVSGKSVSVRVDLGGRRIIKKKKNKRRRTNDQ